MAVVKFLKGLFTGSAGDAVGEIAGIADKFITTGSEKHEFREKVAGILAARDESLEETIRTEVNAKANVMVAELQQGDNFTKRARPSIIYVGLILAVLEVAARMAATFAKIDIPIATFVPEWFYVAWGGVSSIYVIGRSAEKRGANGKYLAALMGKRKDVRKFLE